MTTASPALLRVTRVLTISLGAASLILVGLTLGIIARELPYVWLPWTMASAVVVFGVPVALIPLCLRLDVAGIRIALGGYTVAFTAVVASWPLAAVVTPLPPSMSPWPLSVTVLGTVAAAVAWRPLAAWILLVLHSVLTAVVRFIASGGVDLTLPLQDALFTVAFGGVFTAVAIVALSNARALDSAVAKALDVATSAASAVAREREQARLDALVHDEVLSTLYYASQGRPELAESVRVQAGGAMERLAALRGSRTVEREPVAVETFTSSLRAVILGLSDDIGFSVTGRRTQEVPGDVAGAFAEATAEAVRNSIQHAGDARRSVSLSLGPRNIEVRVSDDGRGFSPGGVAPHRLGIAVSIRGRLSAVAGGRAVVVSEPGAGVLVRLQWRQP